MKKIFANAHDATDLLNTTVTAQRIDRAAHNLGLGDTNDLVSAGLRPKSNAALKALEDLTNSKKKDEKFADLVQAQIMRTLDSINQELDWLHEQIGIEEAAIAKNLTDLDFIATLDEDNILGEDGRANDDVTALLAKHGYDSDDLEVAEIMLILKQIEVDLVADTSARQDRIDGYQKRMEHLDAVKQDMRKYITPDASPEKLAEIERGIAYEPHENTLRITIESGTLDSNVNQVAENQEVEQRLTNEGNSFNFASPV